MENEQDNPIIYRLKQFLASTGLSSTQFADKAGIPRPTLSQLLHGRNKSINNQILSKLDESFPELNTLWLLFGRGSMRVDSNIETSGGLNEPLSASVAEKQADNLFAKKEEAVEYSRIPNLQSGNISDLLSQNARKQTEKSDAGDSGVWSASVICSSPDDESPRPGKKITSIIVLYSDNSFETFLPS